MKIRSKWQVGTTEIFPTKGKYGPPEVNTRFLPQAQDRLFPSITLGSHLLIPSTSLTMTALIFDEAWS